MSTVRVRVMHQVLVLRLAEDTSVLNMNPWSYYLSD